jgi:hypothetical protein
MESTEMSRIIIFSLRSFDRLSPHSIRIGQFDPVAYSRSANGQSIGASQSRCRAAPRTKFSEDSKIIFPSMRKPLAKASDAQSLDGSRLTGSLLSPKCGWRAGQAQAGFVPAQCCVPLRAYTDPGDLPFQLNA